MNDITKKFKEETIEISNNFMETIRTIERTDKLQRKLAAPFADLGQWIEKNDPPVPAIPLFNWLTTCDIVRHTRDGKQYIEIIVPEGRLRKIFSHMHTWLDNNRIGLRGMKAWSCWGVFIRFNGKVQWQYPPSNRKTANPLDILQMISQTAENMEINF